MFLADGVGPDLVHASGGANDGHHGGRLLDAAYQVLVEIVGRGVEIIRPLVVHLHRDEVPV